MTDSDDRQDPPFAELTRLDKLIHEPARLAIATALSACREADFTFLQRLTGLSTGNLGSHLARLEDAGIVEIEKAFVGRQPRTTVRLTPEGLEAVGRHWQRLDDLRLQAEAWHPEQE
ncbi:ArsR family transcriptional regulator [Egibacter rhizosphaerae]|uniref:ArsR family transcriptional regulator n=1 Tax=Egibacter rhizosphaerae TaxID=1670831 RepID=A0A411YB63_9ACTN|nr:transcriptional regulator [Egibacter rhizosphaerae]QBI18429.1 ArsR family transcriptional regulator [Egibacter rhizosphaerae]